VSEESFLVTGDSGEANKSGCLLACLHVGKGRKGKEGRERKEGRWIWKRGAGWRRGR